MFARLCDVLCPNRFRVFSVVRRPQACVPDTWSYSCCSCYACSCSVAACSCSVCCSPGGRFVYDLQTVPQGLWEAVVLAKKTAQNSAGSAGDSAVAESENIDNEDKQGGSPWTRGLLVRSSHDSHLINPQHAEHDLFSDLIYP
jgi:hypothetical protein